MARSGLRVTHLYGLTEIYGPATINEWHDEWDALPPDERAAKTARQGVRYVALEGLRVMDPETMETVPADGETIGEVMFRGNIVMKGYLKNRQATEEAFAGGWFHSGDLGVMHPDGYIQLKDRSKDIIISGGENISSIEVEDVLYKHPRRGRRRRGGQARREMGRDAVRLRRDAGRGAEVTAAGDHRLLPARGSPASSARARSSSPSCPRPRPARSRNSSCARWRRTCNSPSNVSLSGYGQRVLARSPTGVPK